MQKLDDYSGQFRPDLKFSDFSKDAMAELLELYSQLYRALDGFWYLAVKERVNNQEALSCDILTWRKLCTYEMAKITKKLNIKGKDIASLMKAFQLLPIFRSMKYTISINGNVATLTFSQCPILEALEKEGVGREDEICNMVTPQILRDYASFFNPDIQVKCLKAPPRHNKDEICCQWEFSCMT